MQSIVFDTVVTKFRQKRLANDHVHRGLLSAWEKADAWEVGHYVILPDHIHYLARAVDSDVPFDRWVNYWKFCFARHHGIASHKWIQNHWDRRIRDRSGYEKAVSYIEGNPVKHGYVDSASDWPYRGVMTDLS